MSSLETVLVTGANNGIGYETVKALLQSPKPYHILLGSRSPSKGNLAIEALKREVPETKNSVELLVVDLTSDESIGGAFEQVLKNHGHVDVLVNNAGATFDIEYLASRVTLRECFNLAYDVNVSGTNVLTYTFMPLLLKAENPRLLFIAGLSQMTLAVEEYFPTPPQPSGWPKPPLTFETIGYRCSKTALNMLMLDWSHKLKADGVKVWGVGPGMVATGLGGPDMFEKAKAMGAGDASTSGLFIREVIEGERDGDAGRIVGKGGRLIPF